MKLHLILLAGLLVVTAPACNKSGEQAQEQAQADAPAGEQAAATQEAPHWGYEGETGPSHWGTLSAEWSLCGTGQSQSPVDIRETVTADVAAMSREYDPSSLRIIHQEHVADAVNNGHTIQVNEEGADVATVGGESFELLQYHFHSPSEHTVNGEHYPMEMHLVHKSDAGHLAVVGVFIAEGAHNAAFDPIWSNLPGTKGAEAHLAHVMVDVDQLLPADATSYRYDGSLTTPPCSEGVKWIVMTTPIELSAEQIAAFRGIIHGNNRPTQPLNGRQVATDAVARSDM
jgi:carbonic anhydrase